MKKRLLAALAVALVPLGAAHTASAGDCVTRREYRSIRTAVTEFTGDTPWRVYSKTGVRGRKTSEVWSSVGKDLYHSVTRTYPVCSSDSGLVYVFFHAKGHDRLRGEAKVAYWR
jgi:hypothetical protein